MEKEIFKLQGVVQHYSWGGKDFIAGLLERHSDEVIAEYWMGAHSKGPSVDLHSGSSLPELIRKAPARLLGRQVYERFGRLPYLFKILDVQNMLSIQVHPSKKEAEIGFKRENELGIDPQATERNYKDDNHKPEIMLALSEFWLLHGFQVEDKLLETLKRVPEFGHLVSIFEQHSYKGLYEYVMLEDQSATNEVLGRLMQRLRSTENEWSKSQAEYWALSAFDTFCENGVMDKGIYSIFFFNVVKIEKGQGIFQDAGIPHAYLEGQNMELMANSDNVLRAGLTRKHIDVNELLKHTLFEPVIPEILSGEMQGDEVELIFRSPAPDFELSKLDMNANHKYNTHSKSFEIYFVMAGSVVVQQASHTVTASKGEVIGVAAGKEYSIAVSSTQAELYKAKCPS